MQAPNDDMELVSVTNEFGRKINTYDDGFGLTYVFRNSMGIVAVVRAMSWEDAFEICEDEFGDAADLEDYAADCAEYGEESAYVQECYRHTSSGRIICPDLNGETLDVLTDELGRELQLKVEWRAL